MLFEAQDKPTQANDPAEVKKLREMVSKLQTKCKQQAAEIQDLTRESNEQKQELLYMVKD
jgi:molecular chaperone GrpE (heat shock protein)